jgi:cold shock CspA family protein
MYNADNGSGFVGQDGGGKYVFVHATTLERGGPSGLTEGQRVPDANRSGSERPGGSVDQTLGQNDHPRASFADRANHVIGSAARSDDR